jgi:hypothetical protein
MTHDDSTTPLGRRPGHQLLRMRGPADMAAMLPYLLGFYPDDSIVAIALHGPALQQGGAIRLDIPDDPHHWPLVAAEVGRLLIELSEQRAQRPQAVLLYLCRDPEPGGPPVAAVLRPLADHLLRVFRAAELPVKESLCVSAGRWWSFLCADPSCCAPEGIPVYTSRDPGAVVAAATYAGLAPRGSRKAIAAALTPIGPPDSEPLRRAIERQMSAVVRQLAEPGGPARVLQANVELIAEAMAESRNGPPGFDDERAARLIVGLQHRVSRDRGAEYAEPEELAAAQRLWRWLIPRCVAPYEEYAKAPLTLLAWTAWLAGDTATSRVTLGKALDLDPEYTLAELLYLSLNGGLPPDGLREIIRAERVRRIAEAAEDAPTPSDGASAVQPTDTSDSPTPAPAAGPAPADPSPGARAGRADRTPPGTDSRRSQRGKQTPKRSGRTRRSARSAGEPVDTSITPPRPPDSSGSSERTLIPRQRRGGAQPPRPPAAGSPQPGPDTPNSGGTGPVAPSGSLSRLPGLRRRRPTARHNDNTIGA